MVEFGRLTCDVSTCEEIVLSAVSSFDNSASKAFNLQISLTIIRVILLVGSGVYVTHLYRYLLPSNEIITVFSKLIKSIN